MVSDGGVLDMVSCKIYKNNASSSGGGIHNNDTTTLTRCAVFANTASVGADIANTTSIEAFSMDSIADALSLYEEEGITPVEWVLDSEGYSEDDMIFHYDLSNSNSLMKLIYEVHSSGSSNDGEDSGGPEQNNPSGGDSTGDSGDT